MKCPKCGYLGFERVDRCRNCGYDFSLGSTAATVELALKGPADRLQDEAAASAPQDLPLFGAWLDGDRPLITKPAPPRPPLAVRRATPEVPRVRSDPPRGSLDLRFELPQDVPQAPPEQSIVDDIVEVQSAGRSARLAAVVIDALVLASIDAAVLYFTLQICGIGIEDLFIVPRAPLATFLLMLNGGYLVAFTAGGQTLGKMAAGIRVVSAEARSSLDIGHAFIRELTWLVLAAPAGLGLLPTLFSRDRRGIHDRLAGSRVVRA